MTAPVTASERDLRTLAGIVSDHRADLPAEGLPLSLLADLKDQIRCERRRSLAWTATGRRIGSSRILGASILRGPRIWSERTGSSTGTANSAATPTAPATCAPS
jgi:hypothetical protein